MPRDDLDEITGTDVRYAAVVWNADSDEGRPELVLSGCSEYEAAGLLRAALTRLEDDNVETVHRSDDDEDEDEDDD